MLLEFRVKNFRSFKDEQTFSMVASSSEKQLTENILKQDGYSAVKTTAIYGANASGKSNLIKAIAYFQDVVKQSIYPEPGARLNRQAFAFDDKSRQEPTLFEVIFLLNGFRYQYGFSLDSEHIIDEWLYAFPYGKSKRFPYGKSQTWFTRKLNNKQKEYVWNKPNTYLTGIEQIRKNTLPNALFLSKAAQENIKPLKDIYLWFVNNLRIVPSVDSLRPVTAEMFVSTENKKLRDIIVSCLQSADFGITGVRIKKRELDNLKVHIPKDMPEIIKKDFLDRFRYEITFVHSANESASLPFEEESEGTQRFFQLLGPVLETLVLGYTVFIDEFESSLHPHLVKTLLILFNESKKFKGQVVFTTHDTTQLDSKVFRRDQIWFTEKDQSGASKLYPLSDYMPRKGEPLEKGYLSGRYGAIPILKEFGIDG